MNRRLVLAVGIVVVVLGGVAIALLAADGDDDAVQAGDRPASSTTAAPDEEAGDLGEPSSSTTSPSITAPSTTSPSTTAAPSYTVPATTAAPSPVVTVPEDTTALEELLAAVPELAPSIAAVGCEAVDLLALDVEARSITAFHRYTGASPCPGDPVESYVEVVGGTSTRFVDCADLDQTGGCAEFAGVRDAWTGRRVTTLSTSACNKAPVGVCIDAIEETVRR